MLTMKASSHLQILLSSTALLLLLLLLGFSSAGGVRATEEVRPMHVHVAFSGGGIRAQFGSIIAACELSKEFRDKSPLEWPIYIHEFVGLSGGAWGSVTLGNVGDRSPWTGMSMRIPARRSQSDAECPLGFCFDPHMDPCQEVERVKTLESWGDTRPYIQPLRCVKQDPDVLQTCFGGWRRFIQEGLFNSHPAEQLMSIGSAFGGATKHRIVFSTCDWGLTGSNHDGVCSIWDSEHPTVECAEFGGNGRKYKWNLRDAIVTDLTETPTPLDIYDALAMSSFAHGEVPKALVLRETLSPPTIRVQESNGRENSFRTCDHGGVCNMPLAYLRTLKKSELENLDAIFQFDYSDYGLDRQKTLAEVRTCSEFWKENFGWEMLLLTSQDWGYTFFLKLGAAKTSHRLLVHVITFQGLRHGEDLVRRIPTLEIPDPNWLDPSEVRLMVDDYGGFLRKIMAAHSESLFSIHSDFSGETVDMIRRFHLVPDRLRDEVERLGLDPDRFSIPLPRIPFVGSLSEIQGLKNQDPKGPQQYARRLDRELADARVQQQSSSGGVGGGGGAMFQDPIQKLRKTTRAD